MAELVLKNVHVSLGGHVATRDATLSVRPGELVALLGPNGAGKTTLMRAALGALAPESGTVRLGGDDPCTMTAQARALRLAYLPQVRPLSWPIRVRDVVALGRFAHGARLSHLSPHDANAVNHALEACDLIDLADRRSDTLSGGEQARMHVARALAAEAPLLLADEPVASLDPRHQHTIMALFADFVARGGGALVVLHEPSLAARFATRLVWMAQGRIVADGPPAQTLTPARLAEVYGVAARVEITGGAPVVVIEGAL